jgi:pyrroloquinoline quinone biosynthesis protein B
VIVRVLGSAAGGGVPQWNCGCLNCMRARRGEIPTRSQSSIAISPDGARWMLVNASVDLPRQLAQTPALWPHALRENPFSAVLLTDANVDHTAGLGELRQNPGALVLLSSPVTKELLQPQLPYERFARAPHRWISPEPNSGDVAPQLDDAIARVLEIEMIDVPGLLPGYAGRKASAGAVVAYVMRDRASNAQVTVAPVFSEIDDRLYGAIAQSDLALLDGSFYSNDELRAYGLQSKDARGLGHAPVGGIDGTLARIAALRNRRVFVHVNNSNPMLDPASEPYAAVTQTGCEVAGDGWQTELAESSTIRASTK